MYRIPRTGWYKALRKAPLRPHHKVFATSPILAFSGGLLPKGSNPDAADRTSLCGAVCVNTVPSGEARPAAPRESEEVWSGVEAPSWPVFRARG